MVKYVRKHSKPTRSLNRSFKRRRMDHGYSLDDGFTQNSNEVTYTNDEEEEELEDTTDDETEIEEKWNDEEMHYERKEYEPFRFKRHNFVRIPENRIETQVYDEFRIGINHPVRNNPRVGKHYPDLCNPGPEPIKIIGETDQHQHDGYNKTNEMDRLREIQSTLNRKLFVIRFNPHEFKSTEYTTMPSFDERKEELLQLYSYLYNKTPTHDLVIYYMYYDNSKVGYHQVVRTNNN